MSLRRKVNYQEALADKQYEHLEFIVQEYEAMFNRFNSTDKVIFNLTDKVRNFFTGKSEKKRYKIAKKILDERKPNTYRLTA